MKITEYGATEINNIQERFKDIAARFRETRIKSDMW